MISVTLIGVPSSAGTHGIGQEQAPLQLRRAGLVNRLLAAGVEMVDDGDLPLALYRTGSPDRHQQNLDQVVRVAQQVADRVDRVVASGRVPVVLGGDCTITLGVLAGLQRHHPGAGLVYFDGDVDLKTPETTRSGILDGMGVAHLLGDGAPALASLGPRVPMLSADQLVLFGFDPAMLANYPHFNLGQSFDAAMTCLAAFCASPGFAGLVITEVNPDHDADGTLLTRLIDGIVTALANAAGKQ